MFRVTHSFGALWQAVHMNIANIRCTASLVAAKMSGIPQAGGCTEYYCGSLVTAVFNIEKVIYCTDETGIHNSR